MLDDDNLRPVIDEFMHGANDMDAERRAGIYRLAWDFIGSGLGSRNELYERNYLASPRTNRSLHHQFYSDRETAYGLVDSMLAPSCRRD
jgi:aromatic ring hydroxylase